MEMTGGQVAELSGAEIVSRCLAEEQVEFLFGYPGGAVLPITTNYSSKIKSSIF